MHRRTGRTSYWKILAATMLAAACSDMAGPRLTGGPQFAIGFDQENGAMASGSFAALPKGFNPTNPHRGSAIVATFLWAGSSGITSVTDHLTNGAPVGNTYTRVDSVSGGGITMVTYVATNIQNFPDPNLNPDGSCCDQNTVLVVQADLVAPVTEAGIMLSAYAGVEPVFSTALGAHRSASGSASSSTTVSPGAVTADSGALVYATALATPTVGHDPRGPAAGSTPSGFLEADKVWSVRTATGSVTPAWTWFFSPTQPGTWLSTVLVLNRPGGAPPPTGNLTATASTTGSNLDPDGYTATVDGSASQAVAISGSVTFTGLSAGSHSVALSGVAANCTVGSANPQTVSVPSGGTGSTTFTVTCSALVGNLTANTSTTGSSLDPDGYTVTVDGSASQAIATSGTVTFPGLAAADHSVALSGVASNCTVSGSNPRTVTVPSGGTGSTTFTVTCSALTGNLTANTSTSGSSLDPDGYAVAVDGGAGQPIGINSSFTFTNLSAGNHSVALSGVANNCTVSGSNPRTVSVPSGGTGSTTFSVTCTSPPGNLAANTSTTGSSLDPDGYAVAVDGGAGQAIGINSSFTFTNLSAGNHSVSLSGVASNCTVSSNPRTVSVPSGGTASTTFSVSCTTPPGNLAVNTSTTGSSLDPDGYTVMLDGGNARPIAINSSTTYSSLTPGNHSVSIAGVASNCTLSGGNPRTISVPSGGTASTTFSVSCVTPNTAPVVNAGPDQTTLTGLLFSESWSFSDPDNGPWNFTIDWGDGTTTSGSKTSAGSFSNGHTYIGLLGAKFTIRITVTDSRGASHTDTAVITIVLL